MPGNTPLDEIKANRHSILPDSESYELRRVVYDFDYEKGKHTIELTLQRANERRVLRFDDVICSHALSEVFGLYILDLSYRQWEMRVEVGEYYEEGGVFFIARSVEDVTDESSA